MTDQSGCVFRYLLKIGVVDAVPFMFFLQTLHLAILQAKLLTNERAAAIVPESQFSSPSQVSSLLGQVSKPLRVRLKCDLSSSGIETLCLLSMCGNEQVCCFVFKTTDFPINPSYIWLSSDASLLHKRTLAACHQRTVDAFPSFNKVALHTVIADLFLYHFSHPKSTR